MKPQPKRGRGRPKGEPTKLVRAYRADVPRLCRDGETQAEAVRRLLATGRRTGPRPNTTPR